MKKLAKFSLILLAVLLISVTTMMFIFTNGMEDTKAIQINTVDLSNHDLLLSKRLVIYLCCAFEHEFENHLKNNFPIELLEHASMIQNLGGEIDKSKLNFGHKMMVSMIEKTEAGKKPILRHEDRIQTILSHLNT